MTTETRHRTPPTSFASDRNHTADFPSALLAAASFAARVGAARVRREARIDSCETDTTAPLAPSARCVARGRAFFGDVAFDVRGAAPVFAAAAVDAIERLFGDDDSILTPETRERHARRLLQRPAAQEDLVVLFGRSDLAFAFAFAFAGDARGGFARLVVRAGGAGVLCPGQAFRRTHRRRCAARHRGRRHRTGPDVGDADTGHTAGVVVDAGKGCSASVSAPMPAMMQASPVSKAHQEPQPA